MERPTQASQRRKSSRRSAFRGLLDGEEVKNIMFSHPAFRLDLAFRYDFKELADFAGDYSEDADKTISEYEQYVLASKNGLSWAAEDARSMRTSPVDEGFDEYIMHHRFLMQLPASKSRGKDVVDQLGRLAALCNALLFRLSAQDVSFFSSVVVQNTLILLIRWRKVLGARHRDDAVLALERAVDTLDARFQDLRTDPVADLPVFLELKNALLFLYYVSSDILKAGTRQDIRNNHLQVAWAVGPALWRTLPKTLRIQYALLCLHITLRDFPPTVTFETRMGVSFGVFERLRYILQDAVELTIEQNWPVEAMLFRWFIDKLNSEIFSLPDHHDNRILLNTFSASDNAAIVDLSRRFSAYRYPITVNQLLEFLVQFRTIARIRAAIRLLYSITFLGLPQLADMVESSLVPECAPGNTLRIASLGDVAGSSAIIKYLAAHSRLDNLEFIEGIASELRNGRKSTPIYFIDDCAISGTQTIHTFAEMLGRRKLESHHTKHADPLPEGLRIKLLNRPIRLVFCIATDFALQRVHDELGTLGFRNYSIRAVRLDSYQNKPFTPSSACLWDSTAERQEMAEFFAEVGYSLLEQRAERKHWSDARRRESSLGFSDFQRLIVFSYNVPKTTITALWEQGRFQGRTWTPLFPVVD